MPLPLHCGSEADKVHQPHQILLKVITLELATEKYIQIAVVLVSAKCSQIMKNVQKCVSGRPETVKYQNFLGSHFVFIK